MPCPSLPNGWTYQVLAGLDVQVTQSQPNQSRSESTVGVNPTNSQNMICASKKFIDPQKYHHTISTSYTINGGSSWTETPLTLLAGWQGLTDPDLTFDALGNAYLIVEPEQWGADVIGLGMYVYKSTDGGKSWGTPVKLSTNSTDDKQWIDADTNPSSPYYGTIYAAWGANTSLRFARSTDKAVTWKGVGNQPSGSDVSADECYAPALAITEDGTIHVSWHLPGSSVIQYTRSTDGGNSFAPVTTVVTGVFSLTNSLPITDNWPHFPHATFRVLTIVTSCAVAGKKLIIAWADFREGVSRIYYRMATNSGTMWIGPSNGQPLVPGFGTGDDQHFHPQLSLAGNQSIGCTFYDFGPTNSKYLIDVMLAQSCSDGMAFSSPATITDQPWDPSVNAPWSHGDPNVTFIGEYFGIDAAYDTFAIVWTDTRTGVQELFFDAGRVAATRPPIHVPSEVATILAGVVQDGGGLVFIGGKIIRIPPWDPWVDVLYSLVAIDSVKQIKNAGAANALAALRQVIVNVAEQQKNF